MMKCHVVLRQLDLLLVINGFKRSGPVQCGDALIVCGG